uniref:Interleukin-3 receptor subunit alpha n=1 Tax=Castor canadensis TaxID=51338 RepID=A0A8B7UX22_CASCN|nr:interleukin-3 receptor subunit alpha isoform X2 [Castor canadensis]
MPFLWLPVFGMLVTGLLQTPKDAKPPITNLRMEPKYKRLTWELSGNVSDVWCLKGGTHKKRANDNRYCQYLTLSLCKVTNYTVQVGHPPFSAWILFPEPDKNPEAAAANLSCRVHDVDFVTCHWAVGKVASGDSVQYQLFWMDKYVCQVHFQGRGGWLLTDPQNLVTCHRDNMEHECPRYSKNEHGVHVQCHFYNVTKYPQSFKVMVRGISQGHTVSCTQFHQNMNYYEVLSPPNVTADCNKSHSFMMWQMFSHFTKDFEYDLHILKNPEVFTAKDIKTEFYTLPNPGAYTVQIRVRADLLNLASAWSTPKRFVCDTDEDKRTRVWRTALLVALGTLVMALGTFFFCKKCSLPQKLFPPIPKMKDPIGDNPHDDMMAWEAAQDDCPVTQLQILAEK